MSRVSVIVPTLDEAEQVDAALRSAVRALGPRTELIVVDGGSRDGTRERAASRALVLQTPPGRGRQMNAGAAAASSEVLLFLHADTRLSADAGDRVRACLRDPVIVGGCCRFSVRPAVGRWSPYRLLEAGVNLRSRWFRTATGDQAIFARREAFDAAGGFPDYPLFEDVVMVARLRRLGRFQLIDTVASTSRRRWEREGLGRTVLLHWVLRAAFWAGVSPHRLARWYAPAGRGSRPADARVG